MATERTFIMIKPDGVQRGLVGEIIKRFEAKGFKLVAMKLMQVGITMLGVASGLVMFDVFYFNIFSCPPGFRGAP